MNPHIEIITGELEGTRYRDLARGVLERLPQGWDDNRTYSIEVPTEEPPMPGVCASAQRIEELESETPDSEQCWIVKLYDQKLSGLSDAAIKWIIAHELGHVKSGLPCGSISIAGMGLTKVDAEPGQYRLIMPKEKDNHEVVADLIARDWGFTAEEKICLDEQDKKGDQKC